MPPPAPDSRPNPIADTFAQFLRDECPRMAAALAYYTIFSLPPLLLLVIMMVGSVISGDAVETWLQGQIDPVVGAEAMGLIRDTLDAARNRLRLGFTLGFGLSIAALLFGATSAFVQLQVALNRAWGVRPAPNRGIIRGILIKRFFSLLTVFTLAFLVLVMLVVNSLLSRFNDRLGEYLPAAVTGYTGWGIDIGVSLTLITLLLAVIFKVLPDAKISWRDVWLGAVVTAVLFALGNFGISYYLGRSTMIEIFGAAAGLAVLLIWVYYSAMILLLGAEFTQAWAKYRGNAVLPADGAVRVIKKQQQVTT